MTDITIDRIMKCFNERISGQTETKKKLASAIYTHYKLLEMNEKNKDTEGYVKRSSGNILVYGPSGCGKTEFFRAIHDTFDVPVLTVDIPAISASGFKGKTLDDIMNEYIESNMLNASQGIIIFDEFDKLLDEVKTEGQYGEYAKGLINEFLKLSEGKEIYCGENDEGPMYLDTTDILMVFMGSFGRLLREKTEKEQKHAPGFAMEESSDTKQKEVALSLSDFIKHGLTNEFMGRVSLICEVKQLTKANFRDILLKSKNSPMMKYMDLMAMEGNRLYFSKKAVSYIVDTAFSLGVGARGLSRVMDSFMMELIFAFHGIHNVNIYVTEELMRQGKVPRVKAPSNTAKEIRKLEDSHLVM